MYNNLGVPINPSSIIKQKKQLGIVPRGVFRCQHFNWKKSNQNKNNNNISPKIYLSRDVPTIYMTMGRNKI